MPRKPPPLRFDSTLGKWVDRGSSGPHDMQERRWARKADDYLWSGIILGIAAAGVLWVLVIGLAVLLGEA